MSWVTEELRDLDLGDERRNRRLIQIVEDLAGSPESSVPLASRDRAALQGMSDAAIRALLHRTSWQLMLPVPPIGVNATH